MTQEDKQLLLTDLCARLPYGVIVHFDGWNPEKLMDIDLHTMVVNGMGGLPIPYLRPMSSMTEKEKKELGRISCEGNIEHKYGIFYRSQDYLNSIHVDYRGLIEKKLALEAPENMYSIESKE